MSKRNFTKKNYISCASFNVTFYDGQNQYMAGEKSEP